MGEDFAGPEKTGRVSQSGGAPKERRRRRAEKRLSKRAFLESPFLLCTLKVFRKEAERKRTLQKHPFGQPFLRTTPSLLLWCTLTKVPQSSAKPLGFCRRFCRTSRIVKSLLEKGSAEPLGAAELWGPGPGFPGPVKSSPNKTRKDRAPTPGKLFPKQFKQCG